ncbi:MAG TPA: glycosyltransferase family 4 protein [bacterium]|nr:glycosyltransferase family 4 protein [bacterium]
MKILIVSPYLPYPLDEGGKIRIFNLMTNLSKAGHTIDFISLIYSESENKYVDIMKLYCRCVKVIRHSPPPRSSNLISKTTRALFALPDLITKRYNIEMMNIIDEQLNQNAYDIINIEQLYCTQYFLNKNLNNIILSEHNIESEIFQRYVNTKDATKDLQISKWWLRNRLEVEKLKFYEKRVWKTFKHIAVVSERDKKYIEKILPETQIEIITNGVDLSDFNKSYKLEPGDKYFDLFGGFQNDFKLVYTGSFTHYPNTDAVIYFYHNIFLELKKKIPNIKFFVVGKNPYPDLIKLNEDKDVIVTGYVDDVRPYIYFSDVFITPLRIGGGSRLKILQAMGMAKCVVSTSVGAEGIDCENNKNVIIADTESQWFDSLMKLNADKILNASIGENSYNLVKSKYGWDSISSKLILFYENLLKNDFKK